MNFSKFFPLVVLSFVLLSAAAEETNTDPESSFKYENVIETKSKDKFLPQYPSKCGNSPCGQPQLPPPIPCGCGYPVPQPTPAPTPAPCLCAPAPKSFCDQGVTVPLYRYYNRAGQNHFYTINWHKLQCKLNKIMKQLYS